MRLSQHFTRDELLVSETAARHDISMIPPADVLENLQQLCLNVLEPIREAIDCPVIVLSGYRPKRVNDLVGGSRNSDHLTGCAADIIASGESIERLGDVARVVAQYAPVRQVIREFGRWIHISLDRARLHDDVNRKAELLIASRFEGKTVYTRWA